MDLKIKSESGKFKCRVGAIPLYKNKILLVQMNNNGYFCCAGGHIHLGEDSKSAIIREAKEETGIDMEIKNFFALIENFFKDEYDMVFHEIGFYYIVTPKEISLDKQNDFKLIENDEGKLIDLDFRWIPLDKIAQYDIKPTALKNKLISGNLDFEHIIFNQLENK